MRRLALGLLGLVFVGCAADPGGEAQESEEDLTNQCGSALGDYVHEAAKRGPSTVKGAIESRRNRVVKGPIVGGEALANEIGDLIANAEHEIMIQTFDIEKESWMAARLRDALRTRKKPGVKAYILLNPAQSQIGPFPESPATGVKRISEFFAGTGVKVALWDHAQGLRLLQVLHSKTIIVDGRRAMVTDTNIQKNADPIQHGGNGWFQTAIVVEGAIAAKLREDLIDGLDQATPMKVEPTVLALPPSGACSRMIVLGREAGASEDASANLGYKALFRGAAKAVNIITPNLNDDHALAAIADATAKAKVRIVLSKGFNDATENLPGQGGTNAENVTRLAKMAKNNCNLDIRWFAPTDGKVTEGNGKAAAHAKWATADGTTMIIGSQNLDTEAWKQERDVNIVVDDKQAVGSWDDLFSKIWTRSGVAYHKDGC